MAIDNKREATVLDQVLLSPALFGWGLIACQAAYACFTQEPMLYNKMFGVAIGDAGHGPGFRTSLFVVTTALFAFTLSILCLMKMAFGKNVMLFATGGQAIPICAGSGVTLLLLLIGPKTPWMTYMYLITSFLYSGIFLAVHHYGGFDAWEGNLIGRMYSKVRQGAKVKTKVNKDSKSVQVNQEVGHAREVKAQITFADIHGNKEIKQRLLAAGQKIISTKRDSKDAARNGILLFGEPGNGKTVFAEALAGELNVPLLQLSHADVSSKWIGERTTFVKATFQQAISAAPCVLFVDEVDSFLEARDGASSEGGNKEDRDVVNALLTLMVDIRQHKVVLMAATNHLDRLDGAGIREGRFDFKVEIAPPDAEARVGLLTSGLKKNLPGLRINDELVQSVARRWNGFSVKRILAVTEELPDYLRQQDKPLSSVAYEDIMGALRAIQGRRGVIPENVKPLSELVLSPESKDMISQITGRLDDPEYTESHGGTLPTGVLFSGPPGTGKTATAKALAHEVQWGFLPVTGAEMARNPKELEKVFAKAKEIRPCLIFIDEADELLKSRDYSSNTEATNKLLTLMDGINDRVRDVVWIAATNNPDMIDAALLRSGRFTEKVVFELPSADLLAKHIDQWLDTRKVIFGASMNSQEVAEVIGEQSIANSEGILQAALNRAISRRDMPVTVTRDDVVVAHRSIVGRPQI